MAMAIQSAKGSAAASPTVAYPLPEGGTINPLRNLSFFHWADKNYGVAHYMSEGMWNEGTITVPVIPGYTLADDDDQVVYKALLGRQASDYYYDGYYMTVWRILGSMLVEKYADVKITEATMNLEGGDFANLELSCTGITAVASDSDPDQSVITTDPYTFAGASFDIGYAGAAKADDDYIRSVMLDINNHAVDPADMITLRNSYYPVDLPFTEKPEVSGSMNRLMVNSSLYTDFKNGTEGDLDIELTNAGGTTCTITLPRLVYTEDPLEIPTEDIVREDSISFQALGSVDGNTDAVSIAEA